MTTRQSPPSDPFRQIPPMMFIILAQELGIDVRVVSMGDAARGPYAPDVEYWYDDRKPLGGGAITCTVGPTESWQEADYAARVAGTKPSFHCPRVVGPGEWKTDAYVPAQPTHRLFKAPDPDAKDTRSIGLLLEQDATGRVTRVTWYKQVRPEDGRIWSAPGLAPFVLTPVTGSDPAAIGPGPWYRYTQPAAA